MTITQLNKIDGDCNCKQKINANGIWLNSYF